MQSYGDMEGFDGIKDFSSVEGTDFSSALEDAENVLGDVRASISNLRSSHRNIMESYLDGNSHKETAKILGKREPGIKMGLARARETLRSEYNSDPRLQGRTKKLHKWVKSEYDPLTTFEEFEAQDFENNIEYLDDKPDGLSF